MYLSQVVNSHFHSSSWLKTSYRKFLVRSSVIISRLRVQYQIHIIQEPQQSPPKSQFLLSTSSMLQSPQFSILRAIWNSGIVVRISEFSLDSATHIYVILVNSHNLQDLFSHVQNECEARLEARWLTHLFNTHLCGICDVSAVISRAWCGLWCWLRQTQMLASHTCSLNVSCIHLPLSHTDYVLPVSLVGPSFCLLMLSL